MPDIESRLRYLESLTSHQTFNPTSRRPLQAKQSPTTTTVVFEETPVFDSFSHFVAHDTNYASQRRLLLHQEQLQVRNTASGKRLQGIDGVEGRDVLMGDDAGKVQRILEWPQYSHPHLMTAIKRHQNNLLAEQQQQQSKKKRSSSTTSLWNTLFPLRKTSSSTPSQTTTKNRSKRLLPDPAYVLHLVRLRIVDEQPHHAFQLLERSLIAPSVLRKQALKPLVNLVMLLALDKGYEDICIYLLTAGFPSNPFAPIFGSQLRRFPSYFLVAVALKRERVTSWILQNTPTKTLSSKQGKVIIILFLGNINRAWFNGLRALHVAQWRGTFSLTQMLLKAGAGVDRSISYLTYLRCRSYFLNHVQPKKPLNSFELLKPALNNASLSSSSSSARLRSNREVFKKSRLYALDFACATGKTESSQLLLQAHTPELLAANEFVLLMLPDAQVAWEIVNKAPGLLRVQRDLRGNTPLHLAARAGRVDLIAVYLSSREGAGLVDSLNGAHETPLHEAARSANRAAVQFLISHGADCSICNCEGLTALQVARRSGISSEELFDFFHAADTLKNTQSLLSSIITTTEQANTPKETSKRLLIQKLLRYPKKYFFNQ